MNRILIVIASLLGFIGFLMIAESSQAAPPTSTQPILGDANCDGEVTKADALIALRYGKGVKERPSECISLADVDCDTDIDTADAKSIRRYVAGKDNPSARCAPGKPVPGDEPGFEVVEEVPFQDEDGNQYTLVMGVQEADSLQTDDGVMTAAASSRYRSCWSEVHIKNRFGMKLAWLRHYQGWFYNYSRITYMYSPFRSAASIAGWQVNDQYSRGPYNGGTWGYSYSGATFKLTDPVFGWTLASRSGYAGVTVYRNGSCSWWWG